MPIRYEQDDELRRVILTVEGEVTLEDLTGAADRQASAGAWAYAVLFDGRGRKGEPVSSAVVRTFVEHNTHVSARHGVPGPFAIVPRDPVGFAMARMFEMLSEVRTERPINVCRTIEKAHIWLTDVKTLVG